MRRLAARPRCSGMLQVSLAMTVLMALLALLILF